MVFLSGSVAAFQNHFKKKHFEAFFSCKFDSRTQKNPQTSTLTLQQKAERKLEVIKPKLLNPNRKLWIHF